MLKKKFVRSLGAIVRRTSGAHGITTDPPSNYGSGMMITFVIAGVPLFLALVIAAASPHTNAR